MIEALDSSIKIYVLKGTLFIILFLLFIYIPQAFRGNKGFFFAIFKFYFVIIPCSLAFVGFFVFLIGPVSAVAGIFISELIWVTCLYFYCFCLFLFAVFCERKNWKYESW